jgi:septal ring factor EnvC (AmiA/AmiB activator)
MTKRPLAIIALASVGLIEPVWAEVLGPSRSLAPGVELRTLQQALEGSAARQQDLLGEAAAIATQRQNLSKQLIATAAQIQAREALITESETKISELSQQYATTRLSLSQKNDWLAEVLAGLVQLEQNPPPALLASPRDALKAVRAAMLFGVAVPALRSETTALSRDLASLSNLRSELIRAKADLSANVKKLQVARLHLEGLYARKDVLLKANGDSLRQERLRAAKLADKAKTLKQLIEALAEETRRRQLTEQRALLEASLASPGIPPKPSPDFTASLGRLNHPVQGQLIRRFGDTDRFGTESKGIFIATSTGAHVISPASGRIAFAGNFRSYGQLLILDVGEGYHVLLAGLARIRVETGQSVEAGEPVGEMGEAPALATMIDSQSKDRRPVLYVEFRKTGSAIDSSSWWIGGREASSQKGMN